MFDPYTQNAFRVLGLAAEVDPALLPTRMEPRLLPTLWKVSWLGAPDRSAEAVTAAMQALHSPEGLAVHYRTWFRKQTPTDQRALKAIEDGYWEGAADLWKAGAETGDEGAMQNLAVLYHSRAVSATGTSPVWAYWTRALEWFNRLVLLTLDDPVCAEIREHIIEDLVELAHHQASKNSADDVRLVLDIFRRAGLPQKRREQLEEDLLSLELTRLQHACNRIREALPSAFRVGDHLSGTNVETFKGQLENEIEPMLEWICKAQPGGRLEYQARKDVALLLRSLSRAVRGKVETGDLGFMARAVEVAPEGFHSELLESGDAPTESKPRPPEILEDTYQVDRDPEEAPRPRKKALINPLVVVLIVLVFLSLAGVYLVQQQHQQEVARQRTALTKEWNESIDQAAELAKRLAEVDQKVQKARDALQKAAPKARKTLAARLQALEKERDSAAKLHQEALAHIAELKDKLARIK